MNFIKNNWFWVLLVLLLLYALWTANRALAAGVAIAASIFIWANKISNPIWIVLAVASSAMSLLWGSQLFQNVYTWFTGKPVNPGITTGGASGPNP